MRVRPSPAQPSPRSVRYVNQKQTVANPAYTAVLAAAHYIYAHDPAPYNTGTCW